MTDQVIATYWVESALPLRQAAEQMAGEQSTGTFIRVARETDEVRARFAAQVVSVDEREPSGRQPLPGAKGDPARIRGGVVRLAFPLDNFGPSIPNLQAAVAGNLFEMRDFASIKLMDLDLPQPFADHYPGPAFGLAGTRRLMGRDTGVMIGTIVKPSIGLSPEELAEVVAELVEAGIDFIKDDELQANGPHSPLEARVAAVMPVLKTHADRTGRMPLYAFNITDDLDTMRRNHDVVLAAGGNCVMACINMVGLAGVEWLRRHSQLPIHGHRAMFGAVSRSPQVGIHFRAWQKLARLVGVDHLHTNGLHNKFYESDDEVLAAIAAVREPLLGGYEVVPVLSSGQWAGLAHETHAAVGTTDLLTLAGGGIHGHPDGATAGVASMREAWDAAEHGEPLAERAARVPALRRAIETFGR
ncbi:MAG TPA: ribulose-bisphosphate carboxylase large subunit family protein [Arachnia sp.]|nr:ribulose-bisphosphate carboxylase large subunit family protein [Arachnia sp.]